MNPLHRLVRPHASAKSWRPTNAHLNVAAALGVAIAFLPACATTFGVRDVGNVSISETNVLKLTDYPANRDYITIGTIEVEAYRAGLSQPTPDDVWGEVSKAVASRGGNACLLRGSKPDDVWQRRIWVTCEVLSVSEVQKWAAPRRSVQ